MCVCMYVCRTVVFVYTARRKLFVVCRLRRAYDITLW